MKLDLTRDHTFTVENTTSGEYRTFRIETAPKLDQKRVLSLLIGPENSHNYKGFAFVVSDAFNGPPHVRVWSKCKAGPGEEKTDWERFASLLSRLCESTEERSGTISRYTVHEAIPCKRCGNLLTRPESIAAGFGPICIGY